MPSSAEYIREWRAKNPTRAARHRQKSRRRERAMRILAKRHPEEFARIVRRLERKGINAYDQR